MAIIINQVSRHQKRRIETKARAAALPRTAATKVQTTRGASFLPGQLVPKKVN